jgi:hypothetical protein
MHQTVFKSEPITNNAAGPDRRTNNGQSVNRRRTQEETEKTGPCAYQDVVLGVAAVTVASIFTLARSTLVLNFVHRPLCQ